MAVLKSYRVVKYNEFTGLFELWIVEMDYSDKLYPVSNRWLIDVSEYNIFKIK